MSYFHVDFDFERLHIEWLFDLVKAKGELVLK